MPLDTASLLQTYDHSAIRITALAESTHVNGALRPLFNLAETLKEHPRGEEYAISIIAFQRSDVRGQTDLVTEAKRLSIPVSIIRERHAFDPAILYELIRCVKEHQPDIIQTNASKSHFLVRLLRLHSRRLWMAVHHGYTHIDVKNEFYNRFDYWSLPAVHKAVTVCTAFIPQVKRCRVPDRHISVHHNPVKRHITAAECVLRELRLYHQLSPEKMQLLSVGRLSREKGHIYLVEALAKLRERGSVPEFTLNVLGDGPERANLESRCRELGISHWVCFRGHEKCVGPWYDASDVFILPSLSEGSPNVLLEALAAGMPVVATSAGGIPEIVRHDVEALVVRPGDIAGLADALQAIMCDEHLRGRLSAMAKARVKDFYPEGYTEAMVREFRSMIASRSRRSQLRR